MSAGEAAVAVLDVEAPPAARRSAVAFRDALMVAIAAGLGYGFDSYAVNVYSLVLPLIAVTLHASLALLGVIGSVFLVGYTIGTIGFGIAADRFGRRDTLGASILLYGITTTLGGLTTSVPLFAALRFLTGVGGAGELAVGAPYTAEMWPARVRALGTGGVIFSLFSLGYISAAGAALIIVPRFGWRWAFTIAIVPALLVFLVRRLIRESVRYVQSRSEARGDGSAQPIWAVPGARRRIVVGWMIYVANACGYWGITTFLTTFMVQKFHVSATRAIGYALLFYVVQFVLAYVGSGLADLAGRRVAGILGALVMIACTAVSATTGSLPVYLAFGSIMIGTLGWLWAVGDTYMSEFFRTERRGTRFGIMVGGGRAASIFAPTLVGVGIASLGPTVPFLATAGLWLLTIGGYLLGPETRGRELEEVQI
ncbi:MAG: MFS transporter [Chloroflexi bacterium]|nr:MAG: MFS transporter [Chloroflexota bacterium]